MSNQTAPAEKAVPASGRITDEDIERQRQQIGISQFVHDEPHNREASEDNIRHFAYGLVADDNPLWHDPTYAAGTRWRGQIAPPLFPSCTGVNETPRYTPEHKALFKGLYRGVGRYNVGTQWQLFRPIRPGDRLYHDLAVDNVEVKQNSSFSGSRTVLERYRHLYVNFDGEPVAARYENFINAERSGSKKVAKHADLTRKSYTPEEIAEIDRRYAEEQIRGAQPRWWEEVEVGDSVVPVIKGPLGTMDIIAAHLGWGLGSTYGGGAFRYDWKTRQKLPNFYSLDNYGVPRSMMRLHWEQERAEELGLPAPYDYAQMRSNWLAHAVTNWMGDDAWIKEFSTEIRAFNFHGDTTLVTGEVTEKAMEDGQCFVRLTMSGTNQRDEVTARAYATVLLPSREHGPIRLPRADDALLKLGAEMMTVAAQRLKAAGQ
jgi:acyl dehydratase